MHRTEGTNHVANQFTETAPASIVDSAWLNAVQEEIINVLEQNSITPLTAATDTRDQLKDAINIMIAAAVATIPAGTVARNLIMNGGMNIAQRGTSFAGLGSGTTYTLDRYKWDATGTGVVTISQSSTVPSGEGFANSLKIDVTTADASLAVSDKYSLRFSIEAQDLQHLLYGTVNAEQVTLSFWVRSNLTGNFGGFIYQSDADRSYPIGYTINAANTWEQKTIVISGDTSGTINNDNGEGFLLILGCGFGGNYDSGTINTWDAYGSSPNFKGVDSAYNTNLMGNVVNELYITGIQLEVGSNASDFQNKSFEEELLLCQRYFEKSYDYEDVPGTTGDPGRIYEYVTRNKFDVCVGCEFSVAKRTTPTVTIYAPDTGNSGNVTNSGDKAVSAVTVSEHHISHVNLSTGTTAASAFYHYTANADF